MTYVRDVTYVTSQSTRGTADYCGQYNFDYSIIHIYMGIYVWHMRGDQKDPGAELYEGDQKDSTCLLRRHKNLEELRMYLYSFHTSMRLAQLFPAMLTGCHFQSQFLAAWVESELIGT